MWNKQPCEKDMLPQSTLHIVRYALRLVFRDCCIYFKAIETAFAST